MMAELKEKHDIDGTALGRFLNNMQQKNCPAVVEKLVKRLDSTMLYEHDARVLRHKPKTYTTPIPGTPFDGWEAHEVLKARLYNAGLLGEGASPVAAPTNKTLPARKLQLFTLR